MSDSSAIDKLRGLEARVDELKVEAAAAKSALDRATDRAEVAASAVFAACGRTGKPKSAKEALSVADAAIVEGETAIADLAAEAERLVTEAEVAIGGGGM